MRGETAIVIGQVWFVGACNSSGWAVVAMLSMGALWAVAGGLKVRKGG